jgi:23S rRNA pseudouridine1911/1915/1917 synthase
VLCDRLYGGRARITRGEISRKRDDDHVVINRHALHARKLRLRRPDSNEPIEFESPLPDDIVQVLEELRAHRAIQR